jgi:ATP-binding cassette subfamily B protein
VGGLVCVIAAGALGSVNPWLLRRALDGLEGPNPVGTAWRVAALMLAASVIGGGFRYGMREFLNSLSRKIEYDLRNDLYGRLLALDAPYYGATRTGELMARLTNDLSAVRMAAGPAIMYLVSTVVGGLFALGFMLAIEPRLTALALLPMLPLPFVTAKLGRAIHTRFEAVQEHFGDITTRAQEHIAGTRIVRAFRQEEAEVSRFRAMSDEYMRRNIQLARLHALMDPSFRLMGGAGAMIVLGFGGVLVIRGTISLGDFVAFGLYLGMLTWPLIAFGWVTNLFQRASASMRRLLDILDADVLIASPAVPASLPPARGGRKVEFRDVGFQYPARDGHEPRWVFRHVDLTVARGATLGIVGGIGSGKTALLDLLTRVYDPTEGEILLDGVPIRTLPLDVLRAEFGVVPQESLLFSDTLRANLAYGTDVATPVEWAADAAQLTETIRSFPGGIETVIGERGVNLSGGQKQRAALARALARHPQVIVLDDALSAVDTHTEAAILRGLKSALEGRTAFIASHRASAIRDADWIVVLDEGRVVEEGQHAELFARRGRYWELLRRQQLEEAVEEA